MPIYETTSINFDLPYKASSIAYLPGDSYISDSPNQQFQYIDANFDGTGFTTGDGVMNITVRQVRPTATNKGFKVHLEGGLSSGGKYVDEGKVHFTCP